MKPFAMPGLILCTLLPATTMAEDSVEDIYHYRSRMMEASSSHLKALQSFVKGELSIEKHVPLHVDALLSLSSMYHDLFPPGNQHPESEAMPAIWSDPRGFQSALQYNRQKIKALKQVDPGDMAAMKRAVNEVRMSCGDCHYYFRDR